MMDMMPMLVAIDSSARARAEQALPHVEKAYEAHHARELARRQRGERDVSEASPMEPDYVWTVAINAGLNHWTLSPRHTPPATLFVPAKRGDGVDAMTIQVAHEDLIRATKLAAYLFVPVVSVLSAAACTGLHTVLGSRDIAGPFEVTDAP